MNASDWPTVKALFERSLALPRGEREAFVRRHAAPELEGQVLELLALDGRDDTTLEPVRVLGLEGERPPLLGSAYRIEGLLGRGGMGSVWLARRADDAFERLVAVKVLRRGLDTEDTLRRFRLEGQVLAGLQHPGIAQLHDGGATEDGLPYLVMELVDGLAIDRFCVERRLSLEGRLSLFLEVCHAVRHAHERGIVHRDLKPSNVLVTDEGRPKLLDFGIAKWVGEDATLDLTATELRRLTPAYASPEQIRGERISPATDVYALGVLLFELVTGERPYVLEGHSQAELERTICEEPPLRARSLAESVEQEPPSRGASRPNRRRVPRDLATIIAVVLRKEPERRYASAAALAEDLERLRQERPVRARPDTRIYRASRFVRRNRTLVAATAAVFLVLCASLLFVDRERRQAAASSEEARAQRDKVLQLSTFLELEDLEREAGRLWPARPEHRVALARWIARAESLLESLEPHVTTEGTADPGHRARLAEIRARTAVDEDGALVFASEGDRWWHGQLAKLIAQIEALADPANGLLYGLTPGRGWGVARRHAWANRGIDQAAWQRATRAIAANPRYGGLVLNPQQDLLPLGENPRTGLWEFLHEPTGSDPTPAVDSPPHPPDLGSNDPARVGRTPRARWAVGPDTGIVFVLLPGGTFRRGGLQDESDPGEAPVDEVELSPFFLAAHELTQGQWLRLEGDAPSFFGPDYVNRDVRFDHSFPIESVTWERCVDVLARWRLELPSEAQWEYAARAGTEAAWGAHATLAALARSNAANLADRAAAQAAYDWIDLSDWEHFDDGWAASAPVDTMEPNAFGLHHVFGNVSEWCADHFAMDAYARTEHRDPLFVSEEVRDRVLRGGSFYYGSRRARLTARHNDLADYQDFSVGLRAARAVDP